MTNLAKGNNAYRKGYYEEAVSFYVQALIDNPELANSIISNLEMARAKYRTSRKSVVTQDVAISCWELGHNPAGRAFTLANIYKPFSNVEIIGTLIPAFGCEIWEPIKNTDIKKNFFVLADESIFIEQVLDLVLAHPYDVVHLSKPRAPNLFVGVLYKIIWGSKVLIDIDDEELAFVRADTSLSIEEYVNKEGQWPRLFDLSGKIWTRIAVGFANEFDGVTVSNVALQNRYGGIVVHHARDPIDSNKILEKKRFSRNKYGIKHWKKVVLFFGTPREHKGLITTANAIASLNRKDVVFVIVGDFADKRLKIRLQEIVGVDYLFIGNQPIELTSEINALGDVCILMQDCSSHVSQFQVPAKLTDALAIGMPVLASPTDSLAEFISSGAVLPVTSKNLGHYLKKILDKPEDFDQLKSLGLRYFESCLELNINSLNLRRYVDAQLNQCARGIFKRFFEAFFYQRK